jgi:hypothetical protein
VKTTKTRTEGGQLSVEIVDNLKNIYQAVTSCRVEWKKNGHLVKREEVPNQVMACALAASGVYEDETMVGEKK